jgi:hypothetical protein
VLQSLKEKYGDGTTVSETCRKCGYEVDLCTAGTHESNGSIKVYAEADKFICSVCFSDNKSDQGINYNIYYQMILTLLYYFLFIYFLLVEGNEESTEIGLNGIENLFICRYCLLFYSIILLFSLASFQLLSYFCNSIFNLVFSISDQSQLFSKYM